jgi:hypothetical protein
MGNHQRTQYRVAIEQDEDGVFREGDMIEIKVDSKRHDFEFSRATSEPPPKKARAATRTQRLIARAPAPPQTDTASPKTHPR